MNPVGSLNLSSFPINREKEIVYQWNINDCVVYLVKKQDALEYKTVKNKKEIYAGYIEIPESESIKGMISHLKKCKAIINENGIANFLQNFHTWENVHRDFNLEFEEWFPLKGEFLNSFSNYEIGEYDPSIKVSLVLGTDGLVWNVFQRSTKECSFHHFQEVTIPSLRCHPETVALIEKIKTEALSNPPLLYRLINDFKVKVIDSETIKKEYKAIRADIEKYERALKYYEILKKTGEEYGNRSFKEFVEKLRLALEASQESFNKVNDSQDASVTDLKNFKKDYEDLMTALEGCQDSLKFEKKFNQDKDTIIGSLGLVGIGTPAVYFARNAINGAANCVKSYLGNHIVGTFARGCTKVAAGSTLLLAAIIAAHLIALPFFPNETKLDIDKLDALKKRMTPLSLQKPLLIEIEPISAPSAIDERVSVSKFTWAVTLVTHTGSEGNHARIIAEGINDGFYDEEASRIGIAKKVGLDEKFIHLADYSPQIQSGLLSPDALEYETRTEIWMVPSDKVKEMLESIKKEQYFPAYRRPFNFYGKDSRFYPFNPWAKNWKIFSGEAGDNCFTWARDKLKMINIDLGKGYTDLVVSIAKNYTRDKEAYKNKPVKEMI